MTFTPKNMKMPKKLKKVDVRGWSRAPLVLLYSVSIVQTEFGFYINVGPLNQVRNPSKLNRLCGPCVSLVGAFDCIKFGQPGGKIEVGRWNMIIAIYAYALLWLQVQAKDTLAYRKSTKTWQTLQVMWKSSWSLSMYPNLPILCLWL